MSRKFHMESLISEQWLSRTYIMWTRRCIFRNWRSRLGISFLYPPRRFGKSVFLGMLHAYYDSHTKDKFEQWFGNLWIGKHPTPSQGRYQVLHLDFSMVGGNIDNLEEKFNFYLGVQLDGFVRYYDEFYSDMIKQNVYAAKDAGGKLAIIQNEAKTKGYPL